MATVRLEGFLYATGRRIVAWINDAAALLNESRTDHATTKVTIDQIETLVEELAVDHATTKVTVDQMETLIEELAADHATAKVTVDQLETLTEELGADHATFKTAVNGLVVQHNNLAQEFGRPQVVGNISAALAIDAAPQDVETTVAVSIRVAGLDFPIAANGALDISTLTINGRTIATSKADAGWVFVNPAGVWDADQSVTAQATQTSAIGGLAQYSRATNTLPPTAIGAKMVPLGVVSLVEGGSGTFTWGAESISDETEVFYSFRGLPGVVTPAASFAATGGATATFAYGAGICRLGTGTVVTYTGKTGVAFETLGATNVTTAKTGVFLLYVLADDSEYLMQLGGAGYNSLALAQAAVAAHNPNPLLPVVGIIYVGNASGADFVPGTTNLNVAGLTLTFTIPGQGATWVSIGQGIAGQMLPVITDDAPATLAASTAITSGPATLSATTAITSGPAALSASGAITSGPATITAAAVDDFTFPDGAP